MLALLASPVVDFLFDNLLLLSGLSLLIFVYLVILIRKRWKNNFLHPQESSKK